MVNPTIVFSYQYSCLELPVVLVYCQVEVCSSRLHHICQGGYVAMHEINIEGAEQNIFCDCVGKLRMGDKPNKSKKVGHIPA